MNYQERLTAVNAACNDKNKTIWDSIDRPIRPLVYHLNRIGLKTKFSCCGFNYDGEEEPKSHHAKLTYVHIFEPTTYQGKVSLDYLQGLSKAIDHDNEFLSCGVTIFGNKAFKIYHLWCKNAYPDLYKKEDGLEKSIHDYEGQVLCMQLFVDNLEKLPTDEKITEIIDGNKEYNEKFSDWQVKAKQTIAMKVAKEKMIKLIND